MSARRRRLLRLSNIFVTRPNGHRLLEKWRSAVAPALHPRPRVSREPRGRHERRVPSRARAVDDVRRVPRAGGSSSSRFEKQQRQRSLGGSPLFGVSALPPASMPLASAPGSEAFYRRSMRKGVGGDVEGEAMRANLSFQNSLRAETPPLGPPRNARSAPRPPRTPRWTSS